jgi:hypothetical protein
MAEVNEIKSKKQTKKKWNKISFFEKLNKIDKPLQIWLKWGGKIVKLANSEMKTGR